MKKLKLGELRVESFEAAAAQPAQGTVNAHEAACISYCSSCFFTQQADCTREGC
jgi:hypothetical protein